MDDGVKFGAARNAVPGEVNEAEKVKLVAKMFMDSKNTLMNELNYEVLTKNHTKEESKMDEVFSSTVAGLNSSNKNLRHTNTTKKMEVSRQSRSNADIVRNYFDYYYLTLERSLSFVGTINEHKGVEGVYNPLQVIRNRKIREEYDEPPTKLPFLAKNPFIAITQLSNNVHKQFVWYVDIEEKTSDMIWRTAHWNELVNSHGDYWFRKETKKSKSSSSIAAAFNSHLKVPFPPKDTFSGLRASPSKHKREGSGYESLKSYSNSLHDSNQHSNNMSDSNIVSSERRASSNERDHNKSDIFEKMLEKSKTWSKPPSFLKRSQYSLNNSISSNESNTSDMKKSQSSINSLGASANISHHTPVDVTPTKDLTSGLKDIPVKNLKPKRYSFSNQHRSKSDNAITAGSEDIVENVDTAKVMEEEVIEQSPKKTSDNEEPVNIIVDETLQKYWKDTKYLSVSIEIMRHRMLTNRKYKKVQLKERNKLTIDRDYDEVIAGTSEVLKDYSASLDSILKKGNEWNSKWINDYSIRIDSLISSTDRIMSDINTTLSLKLKLFQENAERSEGLHGVRSTRLSLFGYKVLEFFILSVLWTVWLVVLMIKYIKLFFMLIIHFVLHIIW